MSTPAPSLTYRSAVEDGADLVDEVIPLREGWCARHQTGFRLMS